MTLFLITGSLVAAIFSFEPPATNGTDIEFKGREALARLPNASGKRKHETGREMTIAARGL